MSLIKGPFTIKWGDNVITDVEAVEVEHVVDSEEFNTVQGINVEVDGSYKATAIITLLKSDIPALAAVLPQNFVANGGVLSTGETVNNANGAIDIKPGACDESTIYNNLDIISCDNPGNVMRIVNARTRIESVEVSDKIQKVMVKFIGEPATDEATMQFFADGTISVVS